MAKRNDSIDRVKFYERMMLVIGDSSTGSLAARTGVNNRTINNMKLGYLPNANNLYKICNAMGISADWLMGLETVSMRRRGLGTGRKVMVDGWLFDTLKEAADYIGVKPAAVRYYMNKLDRPPKYHGHEIEWDVPKSAHQPPSRRAKVKDDTIQKVVDDAVQLGKDTRDDSNPELARRALLIERICKLTNNPVTVPGEEKVFAKGKAKAQAEMEKEMAASRKRKLREIREGEGK